MKKVFLKTVAFTLLLAAITVTGYAQGKRNYSNIGATARLADQLRAEKVVDVDFGGIFINDGVQTKVIMDRFGGINADVATSYFAVDLRHAGQIRIDTNQSNSFGVEFPEVVQLVDPAIGRQIAYNPVLYGDGIGTLNRLGTDALRPNSSQSANGYFISIAGDLTIPADASEGIYVGLFDVTVVWQ